MSHLVSLANHLLPLLITFLLVSFVLVLWIGLPYLHYIRLVAAAKDEEGINHLAKYLASKTGGRHINVDKIWPSYIPAATELHDLYLRNALKVYFRRNKK